MASDITLRYAIIGDSIQWGQGLLEEHKFTTKVVKQIASTYGIETECVGRYAHSGAELGSEGDGDNAKRSDPEYYSDDDDMYWAEVPDDTPSIYKQLKTLCKTLEDSADPSARANLDLLFVDGGINQEASNGHIPFNLLLDPVTSTNTVRETARETCGTDMEAFLRYAAEQLPEAYIIVTGYYPIFSALSTPSFVGAFVGGMAAVLGLKTMIITPAAVANLIAISTAWGEESADALQGAVDAIGSDRIRYAHVDFKSQHCLFAYDHKLWGLVDDGWFSKLAALMLVAAPPVGLVLELVDATKPDDEVWDKRKPLCKEESKLGNKALCRWASVGHPNENGAEMYYESIMTALEDMNFVPGRRMTSIQTALLHPLY